MGEDDHIGQWRERIILAQSLETGFTLPEADFGQDLAPGSRRAYGSSSGSSPSSATATYIARKQSLTMRAYGSVSILKRMDGKSSRITAPSTLTSFRARATMRCDHLHA